MYFKSFLALIISAFFIDKTMSQSVTKYNKLWERVESFEKKGLTQSALKEVVNIYKLSLIENNDPQQIKSCIYQIKYRNLVDEDNPQKNIFFIDTVIGKSASPSKNILQSMQAEMYLEYFQNNRWKFYNRTKLADEHNSDIDTWSLSKLKAKIAALYNASLSEEPLLKKTALGQMEPILIKGENTRNLRPTLFDFLAHRALEYFMNDEQDITRPAYYFTISDANAFVPVADFVHMDLTTRDTASLKYNALLLFKKILLFHLKDAKPDALLDADLMRLNFVYQHAVNADRENLYEAALKRIEENYNDNPLSAQAIYLRAKIYFEKGQGFEPYVKTAHQYEIKRAKELCEKAVSAFPKSEGGINCKNLLKQINEPYLSFEAEQVNTPANPFRILVKYKNAPKIYFRIIKTSREDIKRIDRQPYESAWKDMTSFAAEKRWEEPMPDPLDYQTHSAEIKAPALPAGMYFILVSLDANFPVQKNILARQLIYVSNISYVHNNVNEYHVLHRESGQPLAGSSIQVWETKYDYSKGQQEETKAELYNADKNGYFKIKQLKDYRQYRMQITYKKDELFLNDNNYSGVYNTVEEKQQPITFLFTDRSLYRPGQTIYFKGIVFKKENNIGKSTILPLFSSSILLRDANGQKLAEIKMVTNEYGSYHASFKLPEEALNGQFSLYDETTSTTQYFNVEEYKRPKFFVELIKPAGIYRINDSITVTGMAKSYAGNSADGAKVKYRVVRKVRYPIWWQGGGYIRKNDRTFPYGRTDEVEITNGEAVTDSRGMFNILFTALPDETIPKKNQPTFYYEVNADVTDINGETRSGEVSVAVAYQMLQLTIESDSKMNTDSLQSIKIKSTNLNDVFEKTKVTVAIFSLQQPDKILRERYWQIPDQFIYSKDEYSSLFPYDVYKDEDKIDNWKILERVIELADSTSMDGSIHLQMQKQLTPTALPSGWYKIAVTTKDKYGEEVRAEKFIQLTSNRPVPVKEAIGVAAKKMVAGPGEKINYTIQTGFDSVWLIHSISKMDKSVTNAYPVITRHNSLQNEINVTENDRGGIGMSYAFVQHNRVYQGQENFAIPWSNKDLNISYQTFRDKLLPGAKENWTVKIKGDKGQQAAAEMLAGMYDASLDQFKPHNWSRMNIWPLLYNSILWNGNGFNEVHAEEYNKLENDYVSQPAKSYDMLLYSYQTRRNLYETKITLRGVANVQNNAASESAPMEQGALQDRVQGYITTKNYKGKVERSEELDSVSIKNNQQDSQNKSPIGVRKNFNETAFFFPDLKTDDEGNVSFNFTIPEALTQWKLMTLAHTKDLASGYSEKIIVTQKPLMVQPNAPRFMREGDKMEFSAKVVNMTDSFFSGTAMLKLFDADTNEPADSLFKNISSKQLFTVWPHQSIAVKFAIETPLNFNRALLYRITAEAIIPNYQQGSTFSDGEEMALPVLTNRTLVTESMPINLRNTNTKNILLEKLLNSGKSNTLTHYALTAEYSSNPAWYAVQALPYLMESPYECADQNFNRYYANTLAAHISNSIPAIKAVFEKWKITDTAALMSNLQKNEELKSVLLQETPWVMEAQNEAQQKKNIALLFDMVRMSNESGKAIEKLKQMQTAGGGFVWFKGGPEDRYITQYILTGIGHLQKLNALPANSQAKDLAVIVKKALTYLDKKIKEEYDEFIKNKVALKNNNLGYTNIQYLYMRSFFKDQPIPVPSQKAYAYFIGQAKQYWLKENKYMQGMIALALHRNKDIKTPAAIIASLKQNAIFKEEMGMYWKEWNDGGGYYWHQAPVESQALMIEAFTDIDKNNRVIDDLKTWLLKQKQTQNWKTTKATAEACYALLLEGSNWLGVQKDVTITLGSTLIESDDESAEAGTGYIKKRIASANVKAAMGNINVTLHSSATQSADSSASSWGAVYWQYFEDLDKITSSATPLKLTKKLFIETNTDKGPVLHAVADDGMLKVGDKIKVRIELRVDRDMEYVHMKDLRAACMEPVNVLSEYKYQGGLGYYESTKDASANFFFSRLSRGTYVFEYPLFVTHAGNFNNGITSIQCMYAPEFTSHSEGIKVNVKAP